MTAIAAFEYLGVPIVIGDLLLSSEMEPSSDRLLPAFGTVPKDHGGPSYIEGMKQKVAVIHENCVIAWAGDDLGARFVIGDLRNNFSSRPMTAQDVHDFIENHEDTPKFNNQYVGFVKDSGGIQAFSFNANTSASSNSDISDIHVGGSGQKIILDWNALNFKANVSTVLDRNAIACHAAMTFIVYLYQIEHKDKLFSESLDLLTGGGCEIAYYDGNSFVKLDKIVSFVWEVEVNDQNHVIFSPKLWIKQQYFLSYLLIRSSHLRNSNINIFDIIHTHKYVVDPVYYIRPENLESELSSLDFSYDYSAHIFFLKDQDHRKSFFVTERRDFKLATFRTIEDGPNMKVYFDPDFFQEAMIRSIELYRS